VLVVVGEIPQGEQVLVGRLASTIFVSALDELDWPAIDARKSHCLLRPESGALVVDRKLDLPRLGGLGLRSVRDELPRDVIEDATVVMDRVTEPGGERVTLGAGYSDCACWSFEGAHASAVCERGGEAPLRLCLSPFTERRISQ
jgi:hypothetical protein